MAKTIYRPEYRQLVDDLRQRRESQWISQVAAAKALRWSQTKFSTIETSSRRLDVLEYIELTKFLGLSPAEAFALAERRARPRAPHTRGAGGRPRK